MIYFYWWGVENLLDSSFEFWDEGMEHDVLDGYSGFWVDFKYFL